jgi:hypothetical protein
MESVKHGSLIIATTAVVMASSPWARPDVGIIRAGKT